MSDRLPIVSLRNLNRRDFLRAMLYGVSGVALGGIGAYAVDADIEPGQLRVTRVTIGMSGLPTSFEGYRIAHLTDIHFGPAIAYQTVVAAIQAVLDMAPDLIVLTGDYATYWLDETLLRETLQRLSAPDGVWAVMGNHDYWTDINGVRRVLAEAQVNELSNANTRITRDGDSIWLAGVDDIWEKHHDLSAALTGIPDDGVTILLAHEPDFADEAAQTGQVNLQLSGHSHGGQVRVPVLDVPVLSNFVHLAKKYPYGLYQVEQMWLYTSAGVGRGLVPRVYASPEVVEITLTADQQQPVETDMRNQR
jgi:predicted MPP superfamily phosphohydrolase